MKTAITSSCVLPPARDISGPYPSILCLLNWKNTELIRILVAFFLLNFELGCTPHCGYVISRIRARSYGPGSSALPRSHWVDESPTRTAHWLLARRPRRMYNINVDKMATYFCQMAQSHNTGHLGRVVGNVDAAQCCVPRSRTPLVTAEERRTLHPNPTASLYFPAGRQYFSGDLDFLLTN
jgi:hypothetical protein